MGANLVMNYAAVFRIVGIPIPNVRLMARPLLPEPIKAIRLNVAHAGIGAGRAL
jgi:hypothetical protein